MTIIYYKIPLPAVDEAPFFHARMKPVTTSIHFHVNRFIALERRRIDLSELDLWIVVLGCSRQSESGAYLSAQVCKVSLKDWLAKLNEGDAGIWNVHWKVTFY